MSSASIEDVLECLQQSLAGGDELLLRDILESQDTDTLSECASRDHTLFIRVCAQGLESIAIFLLDTCDVDLNAEHKGRTALQWACLGGHVNIVEMLLPIYKKNNLQLDTPSWQENSEFYSASLGGHIATVQLLTDFFPDGLKDMDNIQTLLYAACVGGHPAMVRQWLRPSLNVNEPLRIVSDLHDCENRTPFQAACEGSHTAVAELLMEHCGAEVTERLAQQFPDFTGALVQSVQGPLHVDQDEVKYVLHRSGVHVIHQVWMKPHLSDLTHVDISDNQCLKQLDACIPWAMPNLVYLNISNNGLQRFPQPDSSEDILCQSLEVVDASRNSITEVCVDLFHLPSLVRLNLSYNKLQRLSKPPSRQSASGSRMRTSWYCSNLANLNLSHNVLDMLPDDIKNCVSMKRLDLSHNKLSSLPSPWECPLEYLDVSYNQLERFPPSTEQFWSGSLTQLFLNHNQLDQLGESIVKLGMLQKLDASNNEIQYLAPVHVWDCPSLETLNLSHNCLGKAQQANKKNSRKVIEFPSQLLSEDLRSLNLSHNELIDLPVSVCYIKNLSVLDISNNPLKDLPEEMGNLRACWDLKLSGLNLQNPELQDILKSDRPVDVTEYLRKKLRKVQPCYIMKVLVIGPQSKGKSTVVEALVRANAREVKMSDQHVTVTTHVLKPPGFFLTREGPDMTLRIWELAGNPELLAFHPVMWNENSLFLLVWDMTDGTADLSQWLCNIRSHLDRVGVIIVATFRDRIASTEVDSRMEQFRAEINDLYGHPPSGVDSYPKEDGQKMYPTLHAVVFVTSLMHKQDVSDLRSSVYNAALKLVKTVRSAKFVMGHLLPQSYIMVDKKLMQIAQEFKKNSHPPYLVREELNDLIGPELLHDLNTFDDWQDALQIWSQLGSMLYFDVWAEGLGQLYFLDPSWLANMIGTVLMPPKVTAAYKQPISDVLVRLSSLGLPSNIFKPFLQLLKHFDIGTVLAEQDSLLLPCLLPKAAPGLQLFCSTHGRVLRRFYAMPYIPSCLWSRLIFGMLMSADRFAQYWQDRDMQRPHLTYWQEGLMMKYSGGSIVIESSVVIATEEEESYRGILISMLVDSPTLADLAVIGFVTDEVDSALQNIFPQYNDNTELFGIYALCPVCFHGVQACAGVIRGKRLHFALADCAGILLQDNFAHCSQGNMVALEDLIPEFLMGELRNRFLLNSEDVQLGERLGGGAAGTVYKGILQQTEVAVKVFYQDTASPPAHDDDVSDSGLSTMSSTASGPSVTDSISPGVTQLSEYGNFRQVTEDLRQQDFVDSRNMKICRAFSELRQEIVILSKLRHPCLVSLLGVSVRPSLLVVLELARHGSLQSVLDGCMKDRPFNRYRNKDQTFDTVMDKDITFKIVHQIGLGLQYLHNHRILYRDLKSQNILVCSLDVKDAVNVKISDYGISKFTTSQGMIGMVGTPGYMAPEIMDGQAYDEKVDIFSFSMVVYELLTGHPPFEKYGRLHQIHQLISIERCRPSLMEYNVISNFPYLEALMEQMWAHDPHIRPSATDIVRQMEDVGFLLQHSYLAVQTDEGSCRRDILRNRSNSLTANLFCNITCICAVKEMQHATSITGRNNCWVWESPSNSYDDRRLSIYNLASGKLQTPTRKESPGPPVICMAKIGKHLWIGCQGGRVEIFASSCTDLIKGKTCLDNLVADPVAILHDKFNPNKEKLNLGSEGLVYIGVSDGSVQVYRHTTGRSFHNRTRTETLAWQCHKKITVTNSTIHAMCLLPSNKELLVGCGHSIIIVSTDSLLPERRICLLKELPPSLGEKMDCLSIMVTDDSYLWCSPYQSPLIVEFELDTWTVSGAYRIEADLEVYITEVKLESRPVDSEVCQECGGASSVSGQRCDSAQSTGNSTIGVSQERDNSPSPPPRPPKSTKPTPVTVQISSPTDPEDASVGRGATGEPDLQVRPRPPCSVPVNTERYQNVSGVYDIIVSHEDQSNITGHMENDCSEPSPQQISSANEETFEPDSDEPPPVPSRRPLSCRLATHSAPHFPDMPQVRSMTVSSPSRRRRPPRPPPSLPPEPPSRRSLPSEHDGVYVQSLLSVKDTLWVGSSCGEILVIGVQKRDMVQQIPRHGYNGSVNSPQANCLNLSRSRMSLNLESKQMCNLKSIKMTEDDRVSDAEEGKKSGGVAALVQARNLVVAVRNISQEGDSRDVADIAVWEACSAERISSVRNYWRSLAVID